MRNIDFKSRAGVELMSTANNHPFLSDFDIFLWAEGSHYRTYEKLGAHLTEKDGVAGTYFAVWAPNAKEVSVMGDFNDWSKEADRLHPRGSSGIWEGFIPGVGQGTLYKYWIHSHYLAYQVVKADPYAFAAEMRPSSASKVWDLNGYKWEDSEWMAQRKRLQATDAPVSIYEVHLGSWMRVPEEDNRWLTYREVAPRLADYARRMGYTHVEFLPLSEHPLDASWGYQTIGYFAPTSRFGTPQDFMYLVDTLHQNGIGVLLDWVPAHYPRDEHGLGYFDGTHLYEHEDPRQGAHQDWGTFIFNYGRREVNNFLLSNAMYWLDKFHIDGLRVDAVASMIYLDYSRKEGEWIPNKYGGRENLEAIDFIRRLNELVYREYPDVMMVAEESTAWGGVSRPTYTGGLGFGYKWDMGWMHDTLGYLSHDPIHRKYHHNQLTFRMLYAFTENYLLPLSHDEVVHGKGSLLSKMPGAFLEDKFANLRLLFGYMFAQPGKKLIFMGGDIGQWEEWNHDKSVDWHLLQWAPHEGIQRFIRDLNTVYRGEAALHQQDCDPAGFEWIDGNDYEQGVISFLRKAKNGETVLAVLNFTPVVREGYHIGVPIEGFWEELINSDAPIYGGTGVGNAGGVHTSPISWHGRPFLLHMTIPPLGMLLLK